MVLLRLLLLSRLLRLPNLLRRLRLQLRRYPLRRWLRSILQCRLCLVVRLALLRLLRL